MSRSGLIQKDAGLPAPQAHPAAAPASAGQEPGRLRSDAALTLYRLHPQVAQLRAASSFGEQRASVVGVGDAHGCVSEGASVASPGLLRGIDPRLSQSGSRHLAIDAAPGICWKTLAAYWAASVAGCVKTTAGGLSAPPQSLTSETSHP